MSVLVLPSVHTCRPPSTTSLWPVARVSPATVLNRPGAFHAAVPVPASFRVVVPHPLAEATPAMADMRTVVLVGNRATRRVGRWVYTPRGAV